jgi:hypothetical protein
VIPLKFEVAARLVNAFEILWIGTPQEFYQEFYRLLTQGLMRVWMVRMGIGQLRQPWSNSNGEVVARDAADADFSA